MSCFQNGNNSLERMLKAKLKTESEYDKYRVIQDNEYESDFDKEIKKLEK